MVVITRQQQADGRLHYLHLRGLDFGQLLRRGVGGRESLESGMRLNYAGCIACIRTYINRTKTQDDIFAWNAHSD